MQGTTVISAARLLGLVKEPSPDADDFGIEIDDSMPTSLDTMVLTEDHFDRGNTLGAMSLPKGSLVIMIKRDDRYMVPNGTIPLHAGDTLLLMREAEGEGSGVE